MFSTQEILEDFVETAYRARDAAGRYGVEAWLIKKREANRLHQEIWRADPKNAFKKRMYMKEYYWRPGVRERYLEYSAKRNSDPSYKEARRAYMSKYRLTPKGKARELRKNLAKRKTPDGRGRRLTDEKVLDIYRLRDAGFSYDALCKELRMSLKTIAKYLKARSKCCQAQQGK